MTTSIDEAMRRLREADPLNPATREIAWDVGTVQEMMRVTTSGVVSGRTAKPARVSPDGWRQRRLIVAAAGFSMVALICALVLLARHRRTGDTRGQLHTIGPLATFHVMIDGKAASASPASKISVPAGHRVRLTIEMTPAIGTTVSKLHLFVAGKQWGSGTNGPSGDIKPLVYDPGAHTRIAHFSATWTAAPIAGTRTVLLAAIYDVDGPNGGSLGVGLATLKITQRN
jgi:hypothetical protein